MHNQQSDHAQYPVDGTPRTPNIVEYNEATDIVLSDAESDDSVLSVLHKHVTSESSLVDGLVATPHNLQYMVLSRFTFTDRPSLDKERCKLKHVGCWGYLLA